MATILAVVLAAMFESIRWLLKVKFFDAWLFMSLVRACDVAGQSGYLWWTNCEEGEVEEQQARKARFEELLTKKARLRWHSIHYNTASQYGLMMNKVSYLTEYPNIYCKCTDDMVM